MCKASGIDRGQDLHARRVSPGFGQGQRTGCDGQKLEPVLVGSECVPGDGLRAGVLERSAVESDCVRRGERGDVRTTAVRDIDIEHQRIRPVGIDSQGNGSREVVLKEGACQQQAEAGIRVAFVPVDFLIHRTDDSGSVVVVRVVVDGVHKREAV